MKELLLTTITMLAILGSSILAFLSWCQLPDHNYGLVVPELNHDQTILAENLSRHVRVLASSIGPRNLNRSPSGLEKAAYFIKQFLETNGYPVFEHSFTTTSGLAKNLIADKEGSDPDHLLIIGAHYDSFNYSPGADDNASGVAMLLELARIFRQASPRTSIKFVFFTNEEPPFYETSDMGSRRYVDEVLVSEKRIVRMINLESVGYFTTTLNSQVYPFPLNLLYRSVGDFIGFVSDLKSRDFLQQTVGSFKYASNFPTGSSSLPRMLPGVDWSDHAAFWQTNRRAVMVTDSAMFRYPHYHLESDTADRLDYKAMAQVTTGLVAVITDLTK